MKISILNQGITEPIDSYYNNAKACLYSAKSKRLYSPSSFAHAHYISRLSNNINRYYRELTYIMNSLKKTERKYINLIEDKKRRIAYLPERKFGTRRGLQDVL